MISTVISLSLVFGVLILLLPIKNLPIILSAIIGVFSFIAFQGADFLSGNLEYVESYKWFSEINISFGVDALSLSLIAVSTLFLLLICFTSYISQAQKGLIFLAHGLVVGALTATNLILFFIFFEGMLIPLYFLIGKFGGERRVLAATRFLLFSVFGSVFLLAAIMFISVKAGSTTLAALTDQLQLSPKEEFFLFRIFRRN